MSLWAERAPVVPGTCVSRAHGTFVRSWVVTNAVLYPQRDTVIANNLIAHSQKRVVMCNIGTVVCKISSPFENTVKNWTCCLFRNGTLYSHGSLLPVKSFVREEVIGQGFHAGCARPGGTGMSNTMSLSVCRVYLSNVKHRKHERNEMVRKH